VRRRNRARPEASTERNPRLRLVIFMSFDITCTAMFPPWQE